VIKSYLVESIQSIDENVQPTESSSDDENQNPAPEIQTRPTRAKRLSLRYQNLADITVFLQDEDDSSPISALTSIPTFAESR
jgi:hypothetical protein